ncbi:MAG: cytochrome b/b6 domain-containing protein [Sulfurimonas sp.]|nr:cytochrome b/b6 domain-containing protein [Sulfurimonas sp.]
MEKKFTKLYRVWHWLLAFSVLGLLITVALRKTFLSWRTNSEIIQTQLSQSGIEVTHEIAKATAKAIRSGMWEWHYIFAVILVIAIVIRIYMMLTKKAKLPIIVFLQAESRDKLKYGVYMFLCFFILMMTISGVILYYHDLLNLTKDTVGWLKDLHEDMMYGVLIFVVLHLAGVFKHELSTKEPIVSKMIHGD